MLRLILTKNSDTRTHCNFKLVKVRAVLAGHVCDNSGEGLEHGSHVPGRQRGVLDQEAE